MRSRQRQAAAQAYCQDAPREHIHVRPGVDAEPHTWQLAEGEAAAVGQLLILAELRHGSVEIDDERADARRRILCSGDYRERTNDQTRERDAKEGAHGVLPL